MAYTTYEYYVNTFGGSVITEPLFGRCASLASRYIDRFTYGRISDPDAVEGLSDCACEMAEAVYSARYQKTGNEKKSESIDGYSVSYVTEQKDGEDANGLLARKLYGICSLYLMDTGLMYAGGIRRC